MSASQNKRTFLEMTADTIIGNVSTMLELNANPELINKKIKTILNDTSKTDVVKLNNYFIESNFNILKGLYYYT